MMDQHIRILLVDDHVLVQEGIRARLSQQSNLDVVAVASDGESALQKIENTAIDVVLMDISMPGMNGIQVLQHIKARYPDLVVLILTMHDNREYLLSALRSGASGYVLKDVSAAELINAIEVVFHGGTYLSRSVSQTLLDTQPGTTASNTPLTPREQMVLTLLAEGECSKHIAAKLHISVRTVETHRQKIKRKLGINSTAELTRYAIEHNL
ncbi:response regulator transcription factor [Zooshikella marina]|uniref:DNA-binding response regulator n=1 Tax=Zooshikella ganghwensis TaxID=202772 RepID=A0A4P9VS25_9GAMM|nr:response regulator transcription factor [Zooshikella ganghwensis]MBU2707174.1 response regulator transcription factor [Zooshikella ganghwensis]RDH45609.1 DNA-binding response regulator [Zooshikella ganghwensis]